MDDGSLRLRTLAEHCRARRCGQAISELEELLREQPANAALHHQLGICYSGICRTHSSVSMGMAVSYLRKALSLLAPASSLPRANYLDTLGNVYVSNGQPAEAVPCLEEAAEIYRKLEHPEEWAREEYNLGNAWCDMPWHEMPQKWQRAIWHYRRALGVRTKERDPVGYAAVLQNLGTAYRELPGDRAANIRRAISCYLAALRICRRRSFPAQYGGLHNNLGNAYLLLPGPAPNTRRSLRRALTHFEKALQVRNRAAKPCDYAATQFNRGQAYLKEAEFDAAGLARAAVCFREARECFLQCHNASMASLAASRLQRVDSMRQEVREAGRPAPKAA